MHVAVRWIGGSSVVVGALAMAASLYTTATGSRRAPEDPPWREYTWREFYVCHGPGDEGADRSAIDRCLAEHGGFLGWREHRGTLFGITVEEHAPLDACLLDGVRTGHFCGWVWQRMPTRLYLHDPTGELAVMTAEITASLRESVGLTSPR